jgi:hypothetical protein
MRLADMGGGEGPVLGAAERRTIELLGVGMANDWRAELDAVLKRETKRRSMEGAELEILRQEWQAFLDRPLAEAFAELKTELEKRRKRVTVSVGSINISEPEGDWPDYIFQANLNPGGLGIELYLMGDSDKAPTMPGGDLTKDDLLEMIVKDYGRFLARQPSKLENVEVRFHPTR